MAGLTRSKRRSSGADGDGDGPVDGAGDDRGQLLLVSGFALAVLLLALAVALNAAAYTESTATRPDGVDSGDALRVQYGVERGVADLIRATNAEQPTVDDEAARRDLLAAGLANWTALADRQAAADATAVSASITETTNGTRVWQNDSTRSFNDSTGNGNWTLATGVTETRGFRMNVSRDSLANASCPGGCFTVVATNGSADWRMNVSATNATDSTNGTITITVNGTTTNGSCSVQANATLIELSAGRLAGDPCPALSFAEGIEGPYDILYENGSAAKGTYEFVVDPTADVPDTAFESPPGPHAHPVVWSAEVRITYRTPTLEYSRTVWVEPGDDDA